MKIEWRNPQPRSYDTVLGKIMGFLSHAQFYLDCEGQAEKVDAFIPSIFPLTYLENALIGLWQAHYEANYQKAYNQGADKGNELDSKIFGWIDETRSQIESKFSSLLSEAKEKLQDQISELQNLTDVFRGQLKELERAKILHKNLIDELDRRVRALEARLGKTQTLEILERRVI